VLLRALIRRVLGELAAHGPVILHLEQMEQVAAVAPDPPGAHRGATQRRVEVVRDLAVLAYVVGLSALGDAGVQGDGLHRSHSWMSMAVVLADLGLLGGAVPFSSWSISRSGSSTARRRIGRENVTTSSPIPRTVVLDPLSCGSMVEWVTSAPSWKRWE